MEKRKVVVWAAVLLMVVCAWVGTMGASSSRDGAGEEGVATASLGGKIGPDVIVGELNGVSHYGSIDGIEAYAVGTTSCNKGDDDLQWVSNTNRHPVIAQNLFRIKDGRMTQIGQSWLKHGFLALAQNECNLGCQNPGTGSLLGVGCSDPYTSGLNGSQGGLGPRYQVNAATGNFSYPFDTANQTGNTIYKRLQVKSGDVDPASNSGAKFFVEGHYVTPDDAEAGNQNNNASYREVDVQNDLDLTFAGPTVRELPAIHAWQAEDPSVAIENVDVPNDGRFIVATKVTDQGGGIWRYEYAVHNLNSHRSGASFSVPMAAGTAISNIGFHDVPYHSGEPYDNEDWGSEVGVDSITWRIAGVFNDDFESGNTNAWGAANIEETANAIRWGTMYNFWFDADRAPSSSNGTIGLLRSGTPASVTFSTQAPQ